MTKRRNTSDNKIEMDKIERIKIERIMRAIGEAWGRAGLGGSPRVIALSRRRRWRMAHREHRVRGRHIATLRGVGRFAAEALEHEDSREVVAPFTPRSDS